ncbi:hypothetical protein RvY_11530 [Ramazzottius varieornatus]|uniref:FYVE-type domain-containing protein n=1 Tax=Ramazzottius varieornatus TaxID=947166 RepID=A0A1D1VP70_RAMVA|nr:hypothetical protein RvY_11530 [Ramazzottius varieornatus]
MGDNMTETSGEGGEGVNGRVGSSKDTSLSVIGPKEAVPSDVPDHVAPRDSPPPADRGRLSQERLFEELSELRDQTNRFLKERQERDEEFGRHRAMFKDMFMQKEGQIKQAQDELASRERDYQRLQEDFSAVQQELAELKSVAMIAESANKDEIDAVKERYTQEIASMEHAMRSTIEEAEQGAERRFQADRQELMTINSRLKADNDELRRRLNSATSSPTRNVGPGSPVSVSKSASVHEGLMNEDMRRAKDGAHVLRAIVVPLEEEIASLKSKLQEATEKLDHYEQERLKLNLTSSESLDSLAKKFGSKEFDLSTASKSDIEQYLSVLQTQKIVLQDDSVNCRRELNVAKKQLDQEREVSDYLRKCLNGTINPSMDSPFRSMMQHRSEDSLDLMRSETVSLRSADGNDSPTNNNQHLLDLSLPSDYESSTQSNYDDSTSINNSTSDSRTMEGKGDTGCVMCANYELQLQAAQKAENKLRKDLLAAEKAAERLTEDLKQEQQFRNDLDNRITKSVAENQAEISELYKRLTESEGALHSMRENNERLRNVFETNLRDVMIERERAAEELAYLGEENDRLMDRHTHHAQQMQEEAISLPTDMDELHHLLLQYREEVIRTRVGREHLEESLQSEIRFLKDQSVSEEEEKKGIIEMLSRDNDVLRERLSIVESEKSELERRSRSANEQTETDHATSASRQTELEDLSKLLEILKAEKVKVDSDLRHSRSRAQALQVELDNSEAVQRDFVKLSQSLQVELEKIRQSENEVRWQFDEDVEDCTACKQPFQLPGPKKKLRSLKIHCRHCGKIFCHDCLSKEALSGPNRRPAKVCEVCHTILNRDTAPYFSRVAPSSQ